MYSLIILQICVLIVSFNQAQVEMKTILQSPPNIIIIMADDMGFDDVSFHGSKEFLTPNIDALAYHGKILHRLYAPSMGTPSRAATMTGRYPIHTTTQNGDLSNEKPSGLPTNLCTIGEIFQQAGYSTNLIGKWHLGFAIKEMTPTYRGFDYHYGFWGNTIDYYQRRTSSDNHSLGYDFRRNLKLECANLGTYVTDLFTDEAERVIAKTSEAQQPLFLMVNHLAPHRANDNEPLQAPIDEIEKFNYIRDPNRRKYAAMISKLDQSVGRIVKVLDNAKILENSIIIFHSDNGAAAAGPQTNAGSNWPFKGQKNSQWEGGVRVAGAIWSPLLQNRGSIFQQSIYVGDFLPTLAAAASIPLDPAIQFDGIDMWSQLIANTEGNAATTERDIVHYLDDVWRVASHMHGPWKYVNGTTRHGNYDTVLRQRELDNIDPRDGVYANEILQSKVSQTLRKYDIEPLTAVQINQLRHQANVRCNAKVRRSCNPLLEECLYNIEEDPCEENNLASLSEYATILRDMRQRVMNFRKSAWPPAKLEGQIQYDPSYHNCAWTNFYQDLPSAEKLNCNNNGPPCNAATINANYS